MAGRPRRRLFASGLWLAVLLNAATGSAVATDEDPGVPARVTAKGTITIDRSVHGPCIVASPRVITADIQVTFDSAAGRVTGSVTNGTGTGSDMITDACTGFSTSHRYVTELEFSGTISGSLDKRTGELGPAGNVAMSVVGSGVYGWYPDMPEWKSLEFGGGLWCHGADSYTATCPLAAVEGTIPATLGGKLGADGSLDAVTFEWIAPYCQETKIDGGVRQTEYLTDNCPRRATIEWTEVNVSGQRPVIRNVTILPENPTTEDVITVFVEAEDPDGDPLTYTWVVDAEVQTEITTESGEWRQPAYGTHTIEVIVADPMGLYDDWAGDIFVREPQAADTAGADDDSATPSTTTAGAATGEEGKDDSAAEDDEKAAGAAPAAGEEPPDESTGQKAGVVGAEAIVLATLLEALRRGWIRGKAGKWHESALRKGERLERRQRELSGKVRDLEERLRGKVSRAEARLLRRRMRLEQRALRRVMKARARLLRRWERRIGGDLRRAQQRLERAKGKVEANVRREIGEARSRIRNSRPVRRVREISTRARRRANELYARGTRRLRKLQRAWSKLGRASALVYDADARGKAVDRALHRAVARRMAQMSGATALVAAGVTDPAAVTRSIKRTFRNPGREIRRALRTVSSPREMGRELRRAWRRMSRRNPIVKALRWVFGGRRGR